MPINPDPLITLGLFTDPHYAQLVYGDRYCLDSLEKLRECIDTFNTRKLDLTVNLGDSIDKSDEKEIESGYLAEVREVYVGFRGARHYVLGNHDIATLTKEEFLQQCGTDYPTSYYSFDHRGVHCIILDSNYHADGTHFAAGNFDWDDAWISDIQLSWLRDDLEAAQGRHTIVFCHGNLDDRLWNETLDPHVVRNAGAVRAVLERTGTIKAVVQGHYHHGMHSVINGIPYIGLRAMVVGSGLDQNAYAILSLYENGTIVIEGFGQQKSLRITPDGSQREAE